MPEGPLQGCWTSEASKSYFLSKSYLLSPAWSPAWGVKSAGRHLLDEFHHLIQEVGVQEVPGPGVCISRAQGMQIQKGLLSGSSPGLSNIHDLGFLPHSSWDGFCKSWKRALVLYLQAFPQPTPGRSDPGPPEPHPQVQNRSPERGKCRRTADPLWPGGWQQLPTQWNNAEKCGSSGLVSSKELSSKRWCWLVPEAGDDWEDGSRGSHWKRLEGWGRLEGRASLGLHCWSKRKSRDH